MKVTEKRFNNLDNEHKRQVVNFIKNNYNAPDFLKPSLEELEFHDFTIFLALEPIDLFEAGCVGHEIVGVSFLKKITETLIKTRATVIRKDKRGSGIGSKINKNLEEHCKKNGINKICCNIYTDNIPSIVLKLKRGYLVEGLLKNHDELGRHEYIMSKFL